MGYRDPREALHAENEALRQRLKEKEREVDELRGGPAGRPTRDDRSAVRWGMGFASVGAVLPPLMLMMAAMHGAWMAQARYHGMSPSQASAMAHGCPMAVGMAAPRFTRTVERTGRVTETENVPAVTPGTRCTVRIEPVVGALQNCHVEMTCGGIVMYGTLPWGYAMCDVEAGTPVRAVDRQTTLGDGQSTSGDGDPAVSVDLTTGQALFMDRRNGVVSHAMISLDPVADATAPVADVTAPAAPGATATMAPLENTPASAPANTPAGAPANVQSIRGGHGRWYPALR